jgi:hypothetical protein
MASPLAAAATTSHSSCNTNSNKSSATPRYYMEQMLEEVCEVVKE